MAEILNTSWAPDYVEEKRRRLRLWNVLKFNDVQRAKVEVFYRYHPIEWIEDFCITFDPRRRGDALMPFVLFPRQRDFVQFLFECWRDREHGLVEKARDVGITWLACAFAAWLWRFWGGSVVGFGSLKEEQVDKKNNPKTIFHKIRQILSSLPAFMRPADYNPDVHAPFMMITNPNNGNAIIGEAGDNMGRGGRTTLYFKDESAHYRHPEAVEAALGDNTDVQIDMSSVNGINVFYRKRMAGEVWYPGKPMPPGKTRVFLFDWSEHPLKTQAWHDARERKAIDEGLVHVFRQEVDRDYSASKERIVIPQEWVVAAVDAHIKLGFDDSGVRAAGQDIADGGNDKNALIIRYGVVMRYCNDWGGKADDAAGIALPHCIEHEVSELSYDSIGVGTSYKTEMNNHKKFPSWPKRLKIYPWNAGAKVLDPEKRIIPNDKESAFNKDHYKNLKAQSWFRLRARFHKTYSAIKTGAVYPPEEMISLDSRMEKLHELKMQLSQATYNRDNSGKTLVDKQPDGEVSPNMADATVICYNPAKPPVGFFDM